MCQLPKHLSSPPPSPLQFVISFVCTGGPKLDTVTARYKARLHHHKGAQLKHIQPPLPQDPQSFSAELLPSQSFPAFSQPRHRILHLSLLNFTRFLSISFSSLPVSLEMTALPSSILTIPHPQFGIICDLQQVLSVPCPQSLMSNSTDPNSTRLESHTWVPLPLHHST